MEVTLFAKGHSTFFTNAKCLKIEPSLVSIWYSLWCSSLYFINWQFTRKYKCELFIAWLHMNFIYRIIYSFRISRLFSVIVFSSQIFSSSFNISNFYFVLLANSLMSDYFSKSLQCIMHFMVFFFFMWMSILLRSESYWTVPFI